MSQRSENARRRARETLIARTERKFEAADAALDTQRQRVLSNLYELICDGRSGALFSDYMASACCPRFGSADSIVVCASVETALRTRAHTDIVLGMSELSRVIEKHPLCTHIQKMNMILRVLLDDVVKRQRTPAASAKKYTTWRQIMEEVD